MRLYMTTAGSAAVKNAVDTATPIAITGFRLGEDENYTPDPANSQPMPYSVYQGGVNDMRFWRMTDNDLAVICLVKGNVGLITVGNVMLYSGSTAICAGVLTSPITKWRTTGENRTPNFLALTFGFSTPAGKNLAAALDLSALTPAYVSADSVDDEQGLPIAALTRTSIQRIQAHTLTGVPALAIKSGASTPDAWLALPLVSIEDAADNALRGGVMGDGYV